MTYDPRHLRPKNNFLSANYKELLATLVAIAAFYFVGHGLIQRLDPTAGVTDFGTIDVLAFAFAAHLAAIAYVWVVLRIAFKTFHQYLDDKSFRYEFRSEAFGPGARIWTTLGVVFANLWLIVQLAKLAAGLH